MKRMLLVLTVALVMAAMVLAMAVPAMASQSGVPPGPPLLSGSEGHAIVIHCEPGAAAISQTGAHGNCRT